MIGLARRSRPGLAIAVGGAALRRLGEAGAGLPGHDWTAADAGEVRRRLPAWLASPPPG